MYKVGFYRGSDGKSPIASFISSTEKPLQVKINRQIAYLQRFGLTSANPSLKKLTGTPLWEVRILGRDSTRIICAAMVKNEILIVHIFTKKSNKTRSKDLNISLKRYKEALDK